MKTARVGIIKHEAVSQCGSFEGAILMGDPWSTFIGMTYRVANYNAGA
jgi:hypothetical protein